MSELLIMNRNNFHQDPVKNETMCWKKGDVVFIASDGHSWGREELNEEIFKIIKIPGPITAIINMLKQSWKLNEDQPDCVLIRKSLWQYDFENDRFINKENSQIIPRELLRNG